MKRKIKTRIILEIHPSTSYNPAIIKQASIVAIGNELLAGLQVDTNAAFIDIDLQSIGIPVMSSFTVADEIDDIVKKLNLACDEADIIIVTGGFAAD